MDIAKDTARVMTFVMVDATDLKTPETGKTSGDFTVNLIKAGTRSAWSGTITEIDSTNVPGLYKLTLSTSDTDTVGDLFVHIEHADCHTQIMTFNVIESVEATLASATLDSIAAYVLTASAEAILADWDAASGEGTDPGDAGDRNRDTLIAAILTAAGQIAPATNGQYVDIKYWWASQNTATEDPEITIQGVPGDADTYLLASRS